MNDQRKETMVEGTVREEERERPNQRKVFCFLPFELEKNES